MKTSALLQLFLEIEKHGILRSHATLVWEAKQEVSEILAMDRRIVEASLGRGMVSEMDNMEEVAVLVCGLHDRIKILEATNEHLVMVNKQLSDTIKNPMDTKVQYYWPKGEKSCPECGFQYIKGVESHYLGCPRLGKPV